jgi:DNA repair exonuclease SbcCD ATPase subunit
MSTVEKLDIEIKQLLAEIATVERALPTVAERFAAAEAELRSAEEVYRSRGLNPSAAHPGETVHLQRLAVVGACMVVGSAALLKAEHERIAAQGEGLSAVDKARKLDQLRGQILKMAARRELAVREIEVEGEFQPRPVHAELAIYKRTAVETLAR